MPTLILVLMAMQFGIQLVVHGQQCTDGSSIKNKRLPSESGRQSNVAMVFPSSKAIWKNNLSGVQENIGAVARKIARYENVDMLANPDQVDLARRVCGSDPYINVIAMESDDLWARDTLPVFMEKDEKGVYGVNFNFNGWGKKQTHTKDSKLAGNLLDYYGLECVDSGLVGEPGGLEFDGKGTLLATKSSWVNDNRNPNMTQDVIENKLKEKLGVTKVIWIEGVKNQDITDCHIDAMVRFASPGTVVLSKPFEFDPTDVWSIVYKQAKEVLQSATDAQDQVLKIIEITEPNPDKLSIGSDAGNDFLSTYINYLVINNAVIMPKFGDESADQAAKQIMQTLYPNRFIEMVNIDYIALGGGGIHCATHDVI